ncbi:MAG: hypothetical protein L6R38_006037 [Xanthoria sp. 2 TBL-2021]|nr:MAG: hypothetical protein L6R38_006037 [Xanthoria sp. 2 TBL-2021]
MENRDSEHNGHRLARADSHDSQTASEFINSQLQLEADAREALPYAFDHCTQPLGPLRQNLFSCLTCNPPPKSTSDPYTPAGVCYSCSIACHGEHELVELFNRRNFTCDCGTTRLPATSPCTLRLDPVTGIKGPVHSQPAAEGNTYNQNFRNRFCGCKELYDAHTEKGTMFQCLGLDGESEGGCGEDWWHPECILGHGRNRPRTKKAESSPEPSPESTHESLGNGSDPTPNQQEVEEDHGDEELPPGFPVEDDFETFVCYKCVDANPWIKRYASSTGFLPPVLKSEEKTLEGHPKLGDNRSGNGTTTTAATHQDTVHDVPNGSADGTYAGTYAGTNSIMSPRANPLKRRADDDEESHNLTRPKKTKIEANQNCYYESLPQPGDKTVSLFLKEDFRDHFCRCANCYPNLRKHPQLLEEEESYEPPLSEEEENGRGSVGTGSLLDRGEAALNNVDRVRAIEGVMVYNHLKDKVKSFLQPFAESGQAVGAEDIKAYFEKLRGDEQAIKSAAMAGSGSGNDDNRREQSGKSLIAIPSAARAKVCI